MSAYEFDKEMSLNTMSQYCTISSGGSTPRANCSLELTLSTTPQYKNNKLFRAHIIQVGGNGNVVNVTPEILGGMVLGEGGCGVPMCQVST